MLTGVGQIACLCVYRCWMCFWLFVRMDVLWSLDGLSDALKTCQSKGATGCGSCSNLLVPTWGPRGISRASDRLDAAR